MPNAGVRPAKPKFNVCKPPAGLIFIEAVRTSIYVTKLKEALDADSVIEILEADKYLGNQLKAAAKKLKLKLVYASKENKLYIKPLVLSTEVSRLVMYLREKRSLNELRGFKLEIDLESELKKLAKAGHAHAVADKWVLTDRGFGLVGQ